MVNLFALAVFATMDEAAIEGLKHAASRCDPHYECGGVVRAVEGGFEVSELITSYRPFGVDLGLFYGPGVVADFHTHICSVHNRPFADFFSPADAMVNQGLHTVGYMLSLCDWNIRRYDPSQDDRDDEEVDFRSGRVIYLTTGHIVGWVPPAPTDEDRFEVTLERRHERPTTLKLSVASDARAPASMRNCHSSGQRCSHRPPCRAAYAGPSMRAARGCSTAPRDQGSGDHKGT